MNVHDVSVFFISYSKLATITLEILRILITTSNYLKKIRDSNISPSANHLKLCSPSTKIPVDAQCLHVYNFIIIIYISRYILYCIFV